MEESRIGLGYHFVPTDAEMLMILRRKAEGKNVGSNVIERDIYGDDDRVTPWKNFKEDDPWETVVDIDSPQKKDSIKVLYVITKLIKVSELKTHRVAGCGTWTGQTGKSFVKLKEKKIGFKKMFNFKANKGSTNCGKWIMHEYHLDGDFLKGVSSDYVICRIKRIDSRTSSCTVDSGTEIEASNNQEYQERTSRVQESTKRNYRSTFHEEETWRQNKIFKCESVDAARVNDSSNFADNYGFNGVQIDAAAGDNSSCDFAEEYIQEFQELIRVPQMSFCRDGLQIDSTVESMTNCFQDLPELVQLPQMSCCGADSNGFNGMQIDTQKEESENLDEWSNEEIQELLEDLP